MAAAALCVRLPVEIDEVIRDLGDKRSEWLRRVIVEAAHRELMGNEQPDDKEFSHDY